MARNRAPRPLPALLLGNRTDVPDIDGMRWMDQGLPPMLLPRVAPGVRALLVPYQGATYVPLIWAELAGDGAVGRWLDTLPAGEWKFATVISGILAGMLKRRGFKQQFEPGPTELIEVWVKTIR